MTTKVEKICAETINENRSVDILQEASRLIKCGSLVAFPTETVYGLGANALDETACAGIFAAKGRPADNPLIIHISSLNMLEDLCEITPTVQKLIDAFWPGALTIVMKRKGKVPDIVSAGLNTVGVRFPSNLIARALIEASAVPIAAPSANLSGSPSPTKAEHVFDDFDGKIPMIIDGGAVDIGLESTVIDASGEYVTILRPGSIDAKKLGEVLGYEVGYVKIGDDEAPKSPGMKHRHYSPKANLHLAGSYEEVENIRDEVLMKTAKEPLCIIMEKEGENYCADMEIFKISKYSDMEMYARNLFTSLRYADSKGYETVIVQTVPEEGLGIAIMNRLKKAASGC